MWRFTTMNFLCRDMEQLKDVSRPTDRIRQDVSRSPGGDSSVFHNHCTGCHSGMDPMAGAYAYYEWDATAGRVVFSRGQVQPKYLINANTFPFGYITTDDRWDNYWRSGPISVLGWRGTESGGFGAKSLGREVAASRAFSVCQVEKAFAYTCFRPVGSPEDRAAVERIADRVRDAGLQHEARARGDRRVLHGELEHGESNRDRVVGPRARGRRLRRLRRRRERPRRAASAARRRGAPPPPGTPPPVTVDRAVSVQAFSQTVYPIVREHCADCHAGAGPGSPSIAHPNVDTAFTAIVNSPEGEPHHAESLAAGAPPGGRLPLLLERLHDERHGDGGRDRGVGRDRSRWPRRRRAAGARRAAAERSI